MEPIASTLEKLTALPMFQFERPATDDEIKHIESELGVVLPSQYVKFLERFGYASWFGREILGIRSIDPSTGRPATAISDCIKKTKRARELAEADKTPLLNAMYVVVSTDGAGGNYVLFTCGSPLEGQVHWYNFEDQPGPRRVWNTGGEAGRGALFIALLPPTFDSTKRTCPAFFPQLSAPVPLFSSTRFFLLSTN